ncbi:thyroid transcription factor 1-associated protein 26 [Lithobates pipiens]
MASSGSGGTQHRRRAGPAWGKGRGTFNKGSGDGGRGAAQKKAEPGGVFVQRRRVQRGDKDKRWKNAQQLAAGSTKEGQGFALWRKQKVQLEYKKLQRKQKKTTTPKDLYADNYPEHLKHLYLAEEERLKNLERKRKPEEDIAQTTEERKEEEEVVVVPKKKFKNKTSIQKAKEEYQRVQRERANKRKEAEENRKQREEAKELYKKKKMEAFKVLSTKTKKGQPNFNVQMEYLLKKIQSKT